eukprot:CAMPEP_0117896426 /NCGR_PEP_ID=MMETSP0950-20121206/27244_1 /TAXON_ID=44440 /ORGANISM="Chattonella subsalsa, Strain CCMP2191" /LENGTH=166 /DNA_ID=CAMNT_0005757533 /DNA_START=72 /DNA_END=572 /DNA_ORIENTATION=-
MKLKQLESYLSSVIPFEEPQFELEQYPTSAHLASRMIFTAANSYDDMQNLGHLEVEEEMELVHCNVAHLQFRPGSFDTVVMNPPFGTRVAGADTMFLQKAFEVATTAVYSLHKTSTREYLLKKSEEWGFQGEVLAELRFDVPQMYKFHKKKSVDIQVDLIRFQRII